MNLGSLLLISGLLTSCFAGDARIVKVLPHLLDAKGRQSLSPSLYERDAYQVYLREHPIEISALRFDVQWKALKSDQPLKLKVEVRGSKSDLSTPVAFETEVKPPQIFSKWSAITIEKKIYEQIGEIIAWKVTLWEGSEKIAEQESFLW
jgi:hypothetical protein